MKRLNLFLLLAFVSFCYESIIWSKVDKSSVKRIKETADKNSDDLQAKLKKTHDQSIKDMKQSLSLYREKFPNKLYSALEKKGEGDLKRLRAAVIKIYKNQQNSIGQIYKQLLNLQSSFEDHHKDRRSEVSSSYEQLHKDFDGLDEDLLDKTEVATKKLRNKEHEILKLAFEDVEGQHYDLLSGVDEQIKKLQNQFNERIKKRYNDQQMIYEEYLKDIEKAL